LWLRDLWKQRSSRGESKANRGTERYIVRRRIPQSQRDTILDTRRKLDSWTDGWVRIQFGDVRVPKVVPRKASAKGVLRGMEYKAVK